MKLECDFHFHDYTGMNMNDCRAQQTTTGLILFTLAIRVDPRVYCTNMYCLRAKSDCRPMHSIRATIGNSVRVEVLLTQILKLTAAVEESAKLHSFNDGYPVT